MPAQIIGDDGRLLSGDDATAHVLISGYDDGMDPATFIGAAAPLLRRPITPTLRIPLFNRFQAAQARMPAAPQVVPAAQGPVREVVQGLVSSGTVAAGASATITVTASMLFRPSRLMLGPAIAPNFTIDDVRVSADSLFLSAGSVPGEAFLPQAVSAPNLKRRSAQPGTPITITVTNIDGAAHLFRAALFGEASDVSSC